MSTATEARSNVSTAASERPVQLRAKGLCKSFGGNTVLNNVSLELRRGEIVLLRGANGSGKTTLLNILTGHLEPDEGRIALHTAGETERFSFPQSWWQRLNPLDSFLPERIAREGVGRTWQDIRLFSTQTLLDNVAVATNDQPGEKPLRALLRPFHTRRTENQNKAEASEQIASIGLDGRQESSADKISLGQSKRISILRAVRSGAKVLFLDEPLSGLDEPGIKDVLRLLRRLSRERDITLVVVEHVFNIPRILELATTVWTLEYGTLDSFPAEKADANEQNAEQEDAPLPSSLLSHSVQSRTRSLQGGAKLTRYTSKEATLGPPILEIEDVVVRRGPRIVIGKRLEDGSTEGFSMTLRAGEWGVLQAPNGWGKTTLLEAIAGTIPIERGTIRIRGNAIENLSPWKRDLSLLQSRDHVFPSLTIRESLDLAEVSDVPDDLLPLLDRRVASLSGGERQKVALATTLSEPASVRLMDEPFSALDSSSIERVVSLLEQREHDTPFLFVVPSS